MPFAYRSLTAYAAPSFVNLSNLPAGVTACLLVGPYDESTDSFTDCEIHDAGPSNGYADLVLPAVVVGLMVGFDEPSNLAETRWFLTNHK